MNGALPPSSMDSRLSVGAACSIRMRPTRVEPVKDSFRTRGEVDSTVPMSRGRPVTTLSASMPDSCASTASASAVNGVISEGFTTMAQPAASAAPALRVIMAAGKFHGVMATERPTGSCRAKICRLPSGDGMIWP